MNYNKLRKDNNGRTSPRSAAAYFSYWNKCKSRNPFHLAFTNLYSTNGATILK